VEDDLGDCQGDGSEFIEGEVVDGLCVLVDGVREVRDCILGRGIVNSRGVIVVYNWLCNKNLSSDATY